MTVQRIPPPQGARAVLASCLLFRDLGEDALQQLAETVGWLLVPGGEVLIRRGDAGHTMYVVVSGRLHVFVDRRGGAAGAGDVVREVGRGENIGEMALLTGEPSSATVRAVRDTQLISLSREHFDKLLERNPQAMIRLARMLARWLQQSLERSIDRGAAPATIAALPLSRDVALPDFVARLVEVIPVSDGSVLRLTAERVDSCLGPGASQAGERDPAYAEATQWLNGQEREHGLVIYEASADSARWARRSVRQADRVLAVAMGDGVPQDSQIEPSFFDAIADRGTSSVDLVLLHTDGNLRPQSTSAWLSLFPFASHHHLRLTSRADFERLARGLAGRAVGVVLGGGAARAYGHIGVLRALEESGVPIDHVGGTSAGALIAAQYAYGYTCDEIVELNRHGLATRLLLKELTIPLVALLNSKQVKRNLELSFGDARIEDLWLPFFCVSTNLTRAEQMVHRDGSIARWVRASLSIPGVLPPVLSLTGDLLVDGAVLNNVPVDVMRSHVTGATIAVDVSPTAHLAFGQQHRETIPSWRHMLRDIRQLKKARPPTLLSILHRTMLLASETQRVRARSDADLYLRPPLDQFDMFDWRALEQIAAVAHDHAMREIARWKAGVVQ